MFGATLDVEKVLITSGVNAMIPMLPDFQSALALMQ
jgi:hypothetical protein